MVFESIVAELLNKFLGDYVESFDRNKLQIGIFGGDVKLEELYLKETILDDLDLPVRIAFGQLGKLVLKIPWKNLYGAPVEATIEDLYLLVIPNKDIKYDAEKEEKWMQSSKQAQLRKVEEAKKQEKEKDKPKRDDTFVEKLATQIIKNVQVKIGRIHVRYEDREQRIAMGVTLHNLSLQTTDEHGTPCIVADTVSIFHKILNLNHLAGYWNCDSKLYAGLPRPELLRLLKEGIYSDVQQPKDYMYLLGPINLSAQLKLNPKPETDGSDFTIPKVKLDVSLENLAVGVSKVQFLSVIHMLESVEQMSLAAPYRKYRPLVTTYRGHYKEWWLFAIKSVLEEEIRRRHRNWDLRHIMQHRQRCKDYAAAYKTKLTARRLPADVQARLDELEKQLDVFNIVLARQMVESEVEREGRETAEKKAASGGWFSGWWGTSKKEEQKELTAAAIAKQFEEAMTPEEKSKLFRAIDYQEGMVPTTYPKSFVAMLMTFNLKALVLTVRDDNYTDPKILLTELKGMWLEVQQRPTASAVKVGMKVHEFSVSGIKQGPIEPQLVATQTSSDTAGSVLLDIMFETNPLDEECDQRVRVSSQPVRVIYDAQTINKLVDVFKKPDTASLQQLQAAAQSTLADFREMSATGLQHVIAKSPIMDLKIDLQAPYVIIPRTGFYTGTEDILVINLGSLKMWSVPRKRMEDAVHEQFVRGHTEEQILEQMISRSYDQFQIELFDMQVLISLSGEDWHAALTKKEVTTMHLLQPSQLLLDFRKCLIPDDPRLPKIKMICKLPNIAVNISDERLFHLMWLLSSIPLPGADGEEDLLSTQPADTISLASSLSVLNRSKERDITTDLLKRDIGVPKDSDKDLKETVQFTELDLIFEMGDFVLSIFKKLSVAGQPSSSSGGDAAQKLLEFKVIKLELEMKQQTLNMNVDIRLGGIGLTYIGLADKTLLLDTPMSEMDSGPYLLTIRYVNANKKSPDFHTVHGSVLQLVDMHFTCLDILLHQQALLAIMEYSNALQARLATLDTKAPTKPKASPAHARPQLLTITEEGGVSTAVQPRRRHKRKSIVETVDFKLKAQMNDLNIHVANTQGHLAELAISGLEATVKVKKSHTEVDAKLTKIFVIDPKKATIHHNILSVLGSEAMAVQVVMYNLDEDDDSSSDKLDMSIRVDMAGIRVIFLNWFVSSLVVFLNTFQTAQDMIAGAAAQAAEAAKHNVRDMYSKAVRMKLDIKVKAPVVIVPANSKSNEGIMLDFGDLKISNKFQTLPVKNEKGHPAVVDEMDIGLTNLKLVTVKNISDNNDAKEKSAILLPITSRLLIQRNLSASWYKAIPDIEISGRLQTVSITLNHKDYKMMMQVLMENLAEGQTQPAEGTAKKAGPQQPSVESSERPTSLEVTSKVTVVEQAQVEPSQAGKESSPVSTFIRFSFTMDNLIVDLFRGGSHASTDADAHSDDGLARITLHVLSLKGSMLSDGALSTSILLVDCLLDDTRFDKDAVIKRLMERKTDAPSIRQSPAKVEEQQAVRSMVDITFKQKGSDMFVDMRVFGFTLILNLDYMMKIADFFTSGLAKPQVEAALPDTRSSAVPKGRASTVSSRASQVKPAAQVTDTQQDVPAMMTVNIRVERPDIILVETMDDLNTNAIILNTEVMFKLRVTGEHQVMSGSIQDLQVYSCCYNPTRRKDTMAQILRPCSISLAGSTPEGEGLHVDIQITNIRLGVSPGTIELLTRVQSAMIQSTVEEEEKVAEQVDYHDIWNQKTFDEADMWFLRTEMGVEAVEASVVEVTSQKVKQEVCIVSAPSIMITMEAGVGTKTLPMIMLQLSFEGSINNWSSQMNVDSGMTLQMAYYNSTLALWEPLVEPVEELQDGRLVHSPWELRALVRMNKQEPTASPVSPTAEEVEELIRKPPAMSIEISSKENLEVTLTKTCLDVFSNLSNAFKTAMTEGGLAKRIELMAPYVVENDTGLTVTLKLKESAFRLQLQDEAGQEQDPEQVILQDRAKVGLRMAVPEEEEDTTAIALGHQARDRFLSIRVDERSVDLDLPVVRADKRYFDLHHRGEGNDPWGLVSDVKVQDGGTIITLRSILQVHNHLQEPVNVYFMMKQGNEVKLAGIVEPGKAINLPFRAVYTPTNELFFNVNGYTVSVVPFVWKQLQNSLMLSKLLQCDPQDRDNKEPFFMRVIGEMEQVYYENSKRHTMASTCYNIHLRPAVVLKNFLPVDLVCCMQGIATERHIRAGESMQMPTAEPGRTTVVLRIPNYMDKQWACKHEIEENPTEFSVWTFDSFDSAQKMSLDLGMNVVCKNGSNIFTLYCPFWMLNKTGLMLSYRKSRRVEKVEASGSPVKQGDESVNVLFHPPEYKGPVLFSFKAKSFFGKKKAAVRVNWEEWSDRFSLDVAGSSGVITCKSPEIVYQIGVQIQLTYSTLTKQVIFTPYFVLINNARDPVECQEVDLPESPWTQVQPGECTPFWPRSNKGNKELRVRVVGSDEMTPPFSYETVHTTLLRLDNKYGGLNVDVQVTEGAVYIAFTSYEPGLAPALIVNHTNCPITFWEKGLDNNITLQPKRMMMFTWAKPTGSRQIMWHDAKKKEFTDELRKDSIGELSVVCDDDTFWVSFLDGLQRVLLFTSEIEIARNAEVAGEFEAIAQELTVCIHGMGLSIVNNLVRTELLYIGIASSGIIWETRKINGRRFRPMVSKDVEIIEEAYQRYLSEKQVLGGATAAQNITLENNMEVNFETSEMVRPHKRVLRRSFLAGVWFQMKTSPHMLQLHAKLNRLQIDNQMYDCVFPVILAPVPPPKSVAADSVLKPFAEMSIVQRVQPYSTITQYKYFKVLIQEFHIKVGMGFINAMLEMFATDEVSEEEEVKLFHTDKELADKPLLAHVKVHSTQEQKNFYDLLHFSPLKIHLSFSLSGGSTSGQKTNQEAPRFLSVLTQSLGVTLTDIHDVVFKLAFFERQYTFLTQRQLVSEAMMHYVGQGVKQLYVLVLGLDVIGNPYGLVLGLTQGVEDLFYEPFQGAIEGPEEFAEGLLIGVRSLFGHTLGGAAGAVSRITGAMGKGVAALTFDKDYQRKRREAMSQRPANVQMGLARSGRGLVMGVVDGVSGVFTKPIAGAKEEGVEGFFKGVGKGVVGLVTRPTAGVIDFASGSLEAVKRVADVSEEVGRLRPPRFFQQDGLVRPYLRREAEGNKLLQELSKGRYASTDIYVHHVKVLDNSRDMLMLTNKRVMYIVHNDIFGNWQVDWGITWDSMETPPRIVDKGVFIPTGEPKKKVLGLFGSNETGKVILIKDPEIRVDLVEKMERLIGK